MNKKVIQIQARQRAKVRVKVQTPILSPKTLFLGVGST